MTKWVVECTNCTVEFEHSQISDVGMARLYLPPKPRFPQTALHAYARTAENGSLTSALISYMGANQIASTFPSLRLGMVRGCIFSSWHRQGASDDSLDSLIELR
jgi:hypothetical protein